MKIFDPLRRHFDGLGSSSKFRFLCRTWLEVTLIAYAVANLAQWLFRARGRSDLVGLAPLGLIWLVVIMGPLLETLVFQCFLLEFANSFKCRRGVRFALSIVPFAAAHFFAGWPTVISAGLIGGFYFAFTYDRWRRESLVVAIVMTYVLHSSFNLTGAIGLLVIQK